jgi:hypothetical protein
VAAIAARPCIASSTANPIAAIALFDKIFLHRILSAILPLEVKRSKLNKELRGINEKPCLIRWL